PFWGLGAKEVQNAMRRHCLLIVTAFSERFHLSLRGPVPHWRSFLFERGILRGDELHTSAPDAQSHIWLRFCPDFTLLEPAAFDLQTVQALLRPYAEQYPTVDIVVSDNRIS